MNCKPGDLAITTYSELDGNSGRVVRVIEAHGMYKGLFRWLIESVGSPMNSRGGSMCMEGHFPDAYLRPISGIPDTETTDAEQPVKIAEPA